MGQATSARLGQQFAAAHAAVEFPGFYPLAYETADPPPDAEQFTDVGGYAVPAADRHAAADRDAACDEPVCHHAADPDAHVDRDHVGNGHVGRDRIGRSHLGNAVASLASARNSLPLLRDLAARFAATA